MLFRVLGPLEIGGSDLVSADKPRRLLLVLLREVNGWVPLDQLIDEIWVDGPPASAEGNIKTYVSQLRRQLPGSSIERRQGFYRIELSRAELDAAVFEDRIGTGRSALFDGDIGLAIEELTGALELWRGAPFGPLDTEPTRVAVARLRDLRLTAQDALADALLAADRPDEAVTLLRSVVTDEPLRERTWQRLMTALRRAGRRAEALAAYRQARQTLVDELGIEPGPELQELHQRLLAEEAPAAKTAPGQAPAEQRSRPRFRVALLAGAVAVCLVAVAAVAAVAWPKGQNDARSGATTSAPSTITLTPPAVPKGVAPKRTIPGLRKQGILFGLGNQATAAQATSLVQELPVHLLTTWYKQPSDVALFRPWRTTTVPDAYRKGYALHLIIGARSESDAEAAIPTEQGTACGRQYPLSDEFLPDMRELARIFRGRAGGPPLFVTMFDGVNLLACIDGEYGGVESTTVYYQALKQQYFKARNIFHAEAPNALVSVGWNSWMTDEDRPRAAFGRSMFRRLRRCAQRLRLPGSLQLAAG